MQLIKQPKNLNKMIKTININLSGIVFHINEDAYGKLDKYLSSIRNKFRNTDGGDEIIIDIESRIAELFTEKLDGSRQVIELSDVEDVITTMGQPEDYELEDDEEEYSNTRNNTSGKRLFRDPDNKILGGVSSGMALYFDTDTVWIRLVWIVLLFGFGFGIFIYIILWIVIPEANTTSEKLLMRGEKVNIENIEKKIKEEFEDLKFSFTKLGENAKNADYYKARKNVQRTLAHFVEIIISILAKVLSILLKIVGVLLVLIGIILIPTMIFGLTAASSVYSEVYYDGSLLNMLSYFFNSNMQMNIIIISMILLASIPVLLILLSGLRILTKKAYTNTLFVIVLGIIWFAALTSVATIAAQTTNNFNSSALLSEQSTLEIQSDTIYIKTNNYGDYHFGTIFNNRSVSLKKINDEDFLLFNHFNLNINKSLDDKIELRIDKRSESNSRIEALERVKHISYSYTVIDSTLTLNNYLSTPASNKLRNQSVKAVLSIPVGTVIYLDNNLSNYLDGIENSNDLWGYQMRGHYWKMTDNGLECLDCDETITNISFTPPIKPRKSIIFESRFNSQFVTDKLFT